LLRNRLLRCGLLRDSRGWHSLTRWISARRWNLGRHRWHGAGAGLGWLKAGRGRRRRDRGNTAMLHRLLHRLLRWLLRWLEHLAGRYPAGHGLGGRLGRLLRRLGGVGRVTSRLRWLPRRRRALRDLSWRGARLRCLSLRRPGRRHCLDHVEQPDCLAATLGTLEGLRGALDLVATGGALEGFHAG